ncbi:MAG: hypothetical protein IKF14_11780 [Atopobiaceae bacterium]|nr:hypothetical protein [Atopobiaceae bacterium]
MSYIPDERFVFSSYEQRLNGGKPDPEACLKTRVREIVNWGTLLYTSKHVGTRYERGTWNYDLGEGLSYTMESPGGLLYRDFVLTARGFIEVRIPGSNVSGCQSTDLSIQEADEGWCPETGALRTLLLFPAAHDAYFSFLDPLSLDFYSRESIGLRCDTTPYDREQASVVDYITIEARIHPVGIKMAAFRIRERGWPYSAVEEYGNRW